MGMARGAAALAAIKGMRPSGGSGGGGYALWIQSGESKYLRVHGNFAAEEAPVYSVGHYIPSLGKGLAEQNCAMFLALDVDPNTGKLTGKYVLMEGHAGCVYCSLPDDAGGKKKTVVHFWVQDQQPQHKLDHEVKVAGRDKGTKYPPCVGRGCHYCAQGNKAQLSWWTEFRLAEGYAALWLAKRDHIRNYCRSCCYTLAEDPVTHAPMGTIVETDEGLSCEGYFLNVANQWEPCTNPVRSDIPDWLWKVTRTGEKKSTNYAFDPVKLLPLSAEEQEEADKRAPDWDKLIAPEPDTAQAAKLGVPSPFKPVAGHGARPYPGAVAQDAQGNPRPPVNAPSRTLPANANPFAKRFPQPVSPVGAEETQFGDPYPHPGNPGYAGPAEEAPNEAGYYTEVATQDPRPPRGAPHRDTYTPAPAKKPLVFKFGKK